MAWPDDEADQVGGIYEWPDYPRQFTPEQRLDAYWYAVHHRRHAPEVTEDWWAIFRAAERLHDKREAILAGVRAELPPPPAAAAPVSRPLTSVAEERIAQARANLDRTEAVELGWRQAHADESGGDEHAAGPGKTPQDDPNSVDGA